VFRHCGRSMIRTNVVILRNLLPTPHDSFSHLAIDKDGSVRNLIATIIGEHSPNGFVTTCKALALISCNLGRVL
jgi:hypothetical protein